MGTQFTIIDKWLMACYLIAGLTVARGSANELSSTIHAGAYAQEITPPRFPISVNGNMSDQLATAAHDPLYARCLVLKESKNGNRSATSLAIVVCDSCMIPRDLMDRAKELAATKTGIPASNILISATHAHSCPTLTGVFQSDPDLDYVEFLIKQIAQGIENAQLQLEPARIGWGAFQGPPADQSILLFNRRWLLKDDARVENPFGETSDRVATNPGLSNPKVEKSINLIDPELSLLSVQSREGRPIALLANYSLHYVGGVSGNVVSADYFGEFAQRVARKLKATNLKPPFVGIMSNGTSGDVNNVDFRQKSLPARQPYEQMGYVAETLAQEASRVCEQMEYHTELPLGVRETEIEIGVRKPTDDEVRDAEQKLANAERPLKGAPLIYARETTLLAKYPSVVKVKLQAIKIGSLAIVSSPCETFTETGLAIKKGSPFAKTFTISLANGYNGYLPPPQEHLRGGYETWRARSSYVATDAEPKVRQSILQLLSELNKGLESQ
jgi:neutral ceramidase